MQLYIDLYIKNKSSTEINDFLKALGESCPNIYIGSLKMKIQNIKQLCIELNIEDTLKISPLSKYSKTCKSVFINLLKQNNIVKG